MDESQLAKALSTSQLYHFFKVRLHFILLRDKEVLGVHLEDSVGRRWMMQDLAWKGTTNAALTEFGRFGGYLLRQKLICALHYNTLLSIPMLFVKLELNVGVASLASFIYEAESQRIFLNGVLLVKFSGKQHLELSLIVQYAFIPHA